MSPFLHIRTIKLSSSCQSSPQTSEKVASATAVMKSSVCRSSLLKPTGFPLIPSTLTEPLGEPISIRRPQAVMGGDGFVVDRIPHDGHQGRTQLLPRRRKTASF